MKLYKIILLLLIAMSISVVTPVLAAVVKPETRTEKPVDQRSQALSNRIKEIRKMDKSNLTKEEKKALKEEKKALKKEKRKGNGIIFGLGIVGLALVVLLLVWIL
jgi:Skp family chaperone for outer membrane proteins